jgi:uncharacterized protein (DUF362 family)
MRFSGKGPSRREALAASAAVLHGCSRTSPQAPAPPVMIARAQKYDGTIYDTVRRMLVEHKLDVRGKSVLLKPNLVEFESGSVINTNPLVVHAAFEACRALGAGSVRIAEGPGHRRVTYDLAEGAGYFGAIKDFEDVFTDLNLDEVSEVKLSSPKSKLKSLYLPKTVLGADLIISMPKMKTHHWVGATLSMKNFFGTVPGAVYGWPKNVLHWAGIEECIADLHSVFPRHFAIVDGIEGMEGNGPIQGSRKYAGVLVAGRDLVAVDATCCRIMGLDPTRVRYLQLAGWSGAAAVPQIGESIQSVRTSFSVIPQLQHLVETSAAASVHDRTPANA